MTTKTVYISNDGKMFETQNECFEYETKQERKILTHCNFDNYNSMSLLQAKNGTIYVQINEGDFRSGGIIFDGTFKEFVKKYFNKIC